MRRHALAGAFAALTYSSFVWSSAPIAVRRLPASRGRASTTVSEFLMRSAHAPTLETLRQRADVLDVGGLPLAALADRMAILRAGRWTPDDLNRVGVAALATGRLERAAFTAKALASRGVAEGSMPPAFRAALASYELRMGRVAQAARVLPAPAELARIEAPAARTRALLTAATVRAAENRVDAAIEILDAVAKSMGTTEEGNLARLQLARLLYESRRFADAMGQLMNVQKSSPYWYDGLNVAAWASYKVGDDNLVLGQTMSLNSPHLYWKFNPESFVLESASLFRLCYYESAGRTLERMRKRYAKLPDAAARFRREFGAQANTVEMLRKYVKGEAEAPLGYSEQEWRLLVDAIVSQELMSDADRILAQIDKEREFIESRLGGSSDRWVGRLRMDYKQEWDLARREAYAMGIRAISQAIDNVARESARNLESALAIEVEINTKVRERLMTGARPRRKEVDFETEVRRGYEFWPFEGEYWRDEVGGYAFATTDMCSVESTPRPKPAAQEGEAG
jgi:tetratricopeptide (TPR) repeat protein